MRALRRYHPEIDLDEPVPSKFLEKMKVKNDFCIFLEDENGDIIYLSTNQPGVGSPKIKISGDPCA